MTTQVFDATEYSNVPLTMLQESPTNPRRHFDKAFLKELAESIRSNGLLQPLLVRPRNEHLEIVFGAQRYRAAQIAESETVPVRIREMTDAQVLEAQLVENLQRRDVHPMEEAEGFRALLNLEEPKYSIEQIAAKTGKPASFVATRLKLVDLIPAAVEAFYRDEIGVGHALLLARLQPPQQEQALAACHTETYGGNKPKKVLLPVRHLQQWIEQNVMLILKDAPFDRKDAELVPAAGSCVDCPKRTGHNKLLFAGISDRADACSDPACWSAKLDAHVKKTVAAKPKLVQISTAFAKPAEGSPVVARNQYVEIRQEKPKNKYQQEAPEFKTCKHMTEAIVADGPDKGEIRKVCANPDCPVHHPKKQQRRAGVDAAIKAQQEKQRRFAAIANATGIRVLAAISAAVPVRLMKRDLLFIAERLAALVDESRLEIVARHRGIKREKGSGSFAKLFGAYLRRSEESVLGSVLVELAIVLTTARQQTAQVLKEAAAVYKVDTDAIAAKVKQEFVTKEKPKTAKKPAPEPSAKQQAKTHRNAAAA
ncbi:MAG: ParB/RepB/Spo0J family partition protein [Acidobacteriota bacterium]